MITFNTILAHKVYCSFNLMSKRKVYVYTYLCKYSNKCKHRKLLSLAFFNMHDLIYFDPIIYKRNTRNSLCHCYNKYVSKETWSFDH